MYPLFNIWLQNFTHLYPNVRINTANTGSGQGQAHVERGIVQIGGSAAFLTNDQQATNPSILNIALAVTADIVEYNIVLGNGSRISDGIHLNFTAPLLSQIYNSTIHYWDDPLIKQINPGAAPYLPHELIYPTYRSDAAGDTLFFTQYLSSEDPWWNATVIPGLTVTWPPCTPTIDTPCPQSSLGNPGIVLTTGARAGSISYVSVEALDQWVLCKTQDPLCSAWDTPGHGLGSGFLQNRAGNFVQATLGNVKASINALAPQTPADERFPLINAQGPNAYPIVGYGYALVNRQQATPEFALVLRTFLRFCLYPSYGASLNYLNVYHFAPLPSATTQLSLNQVAYIGP